MHKTILYMAVTINGYIAKENNETPWSKEEWSSFSNFIKDKKNIIIGRNTYNLMKEEDEFDKIGNPMVVVVSKNKVLDENIITVRSPKEAVDVLKEKGFNEFVVAGGGQLNSSF